jgi:hypothetical protein
MIVNNFDDAAATKDRGKYIVLDAPQGSRRGQHPWIAIDRGYSPQSASHRRDTAYRGARFGLVLLAALLAVFGIERSAEAGSKNCTKAADMTETCLRDGIIHANMQETYTIWLGNGQIKLTSALPPVTTTGWLYIVGQGADKTTIRGSCKGRDGADFHCVSGAAGIFTVGKGGALIIQSIRVTNGDNAIFNEGYFASYFSTIAWNHGSVERNGGGGIANWGPDSQIYLQDSTVNNNYVSFVNGNDPWIGGGGIFNGGGRVEIVNSTIHSNRAFVGGGGGIANNDGVLAIANSTIYGNLDDGQSHGRFLNHAGGIVNKGIGEVWLGSVTITNNITPDQSIAHSWANGVFNYENSKLYFFNTIIARNGKTRHGPDCGGLVYSLGGNLLGDCQVVRKYDWDPDPVVVPRAGDVEVLDDSGLDEGSPYYHDPSFDILIGTPLLKDNGGSSCTVALKYTKTSPALNKGWTGAPGSHGLACAEYDQRGVRRNRCDIGAYEYDPGAFGGKYTPSGLECPH